MLFKTGQHCLQYFGRIFILDLEKVSFGKKNCAKVTETACCGLCGKYEKYLVWKKERKAALFINDVICFGFYMWSTLW
jgi:hypothetical protein